MFARQSLDFIVHVRRPSHLVDCRIEMIYPRSMKWIFGKKIQKLMVVSMKNDTRTRQWIRGWSCCLSLLQSLKPNTSKSTLTSLFGSNHSGQETCMYTALLWTLCECRVLGIASKWFLKVTICYWSHCSSLFYTWT